MSKRSVASGSSRVSHALIGIARDLEVRMLTRLHDDGGYRGLRPSLGPLLSLIWFEPRPLGALAQALGVSKQACSRLTGVALKAGLLVRIAPSARSVPASTRVGARGRVVALSGRGRKLVKEAIRVLREAEDEYAQRLGPVRFRQLVAAVARLHRALNVQPAIGSRSTADAPALGGLPQLAVELQRRLIEATASRGHRGLKPAQALVLPLIGREGSRVRDLARSHRVSRQSISLTGLELEGLGYLRREADPTDRRGTMLYRTPRGERLLADADVAAGVLDRDLAALVGPTRFEELREGSRVLFDALQASDPPEWRIGTTRVRLRVVTSPPNARSTGSDLEALAASLLHRLGEARAARLGALLVATREAPSNAVGMRRPTGRSA